MDSNFRFRERCKSDLRRQSPASAATRRDPIICGCVTAGSIPCRSRFAIDSPLELPVPRALRLRVPGGRFGPPSEMSADSKPQSPAFRPS
jgi:hypothetical protein